MWPFLKRNKKKKSFMRAYYTSAKFNINTTRLKLKKKKKTDCVTYQALRKSPLGQEEDNTA